MILATARIWTVTVTGWHASSDNPARVPGGEVTMGFSVRIAPGVRASSRGMRASIGPLPTGAWLAAFYDRVHGGPPLRVEQEASAQIPAYVVDISSVRVVADAHS